MKKSLMFILCVLPTFCLNLFAREITVSDADSNKKVVLQPNDTLRIDLVGNPTTGFTWEIVQNGSPQLEGIETSYASASTLCGSPGTFSFWFKAESLGSSRLTLNYVRPWDKKTTPEKEFTLCIVVESK